MSKTLGILSVVAIVLGFSSQAFACGTGGSSSRGISCDQAYRQAWANGNYGRGGPWDPNAGRGRVHGGRPVMGGRQVRGGRHFGGQQGRVLVRRTVVRQGGAAGGGVVVTGRYRQVELRRGENFAVAQPVPLTPGATKPALKSPYENLGSKDGVTYFAIDAD